MKNKITNLLLFAIVSLLFIQCNNSSTTKNQNENDTVVSQEINPLDTFAFKDYNTIAQILAGQTPEDTSFLADIVNSNTFKNYKAEFDVMWEKHSKELNKITLWSNENLDKEDSIFYPFSGPDFNYLDAVFPNCKFTVLIGLEKGGKIPFSDDTSIKNYNNILNMITHSVVTNIGYSFFRTKSMAKDLDGYIKGTLPIVMTFMARHDFDIVNINPVFINSEGSIEYSNPEQMWEYTLDKDFNDAYEVIYKKTDETEYRKLVYFSMDVSNAEIDSVSFTAMTRKYFKNKTTFLKAASYLLDYPFFSIVKSCILDNSNRVVTGPSGLQYRDIDSTWTVDLYGYYNGPIGLFSARQQPELKEAYKNGNPKEIDFLFDYHTGSASLYVATKKK